MLNLQKMQEAGGGEIPKCVMTPGGNTDINTEEEYSIRSLAWTLPEVNVS